MSAERANLAGATWLKEYYKTRQAELRRLRGLAPELAEQARELFRQLPADEMEDEQPLEFTANAAGELIVRLPDDRHYFLFERHAVRLSVTGADAGEMVLWRDGIETERRTFALSEAGEWLDRLDRHRGPMPMSPNLTEEQS